MASVKELVNTSLESKIYTTELAKNDNWDEATNKKDNKVVENRERIVTFMDNSHVYEFSTERGCTFSSSNYK